MDRRDAIEIIKGYLKVEESWLSDSGSNRRDIEAQSQAISDMETLEMLRKVVEKAYPSGQDAYHVGKRTAYMHVIEWINYSEALRAEAKRLGIEVKDA